MKKEDLLSAALDCARDLGYQNMTRDDVAGYADCAPSLIHYYFETMEGLRKEVMYSAIEKEDVYVLLQGLVVKNPTAIRAPQPLIDEALQTVCAEAKGCSN